MKTLSFIELEEASKSKYPMGAINLLIHQKYKAFGYDQTQIWIRNSLKNWKWEDHLNVKEDFIQRVEKNTNFIPFRQELMQIILDSNYDASEAWVNQINNEGFSKKAIYDILIELFVYIQFHPKTANIETYYDELTEFLDGFTAWGKGFRLLPDAPDL